MGTTGRPPVRTQTVRREAGTAKTDITPECPRLAFVALSPRTPPSVQFRRLDRKERAWVTDKRSEHGPPSAALLLRATPRAAAARVLFTRAERRWPSLGSLPGAGSLRRMAILPCSACGDHEPIHLADTSRDIDEDYYICPSCGHMWMVTKKRRRRVTERIARSFQPTGSHRA